MENIWHSISHKKTSSCPSSSVTNLPASQCHAAREVQPGPRVGRNHFWEQRSGQIMGFTFEACWANNATNDESDFEPMNQKILSTKYALKNTAPKHSSKGDEFYRFLPMRKSGRRNVARFFQTITVIFSF